MSRQYVRVTNRDMQVIEWLKIVRIADMEGVRAGLEAHSGGQKQSMRLAYRWVERMKQARYVRAETPFYGAGQICWVTPLAGGSPKKPNLLSQVARHDVQVARISALWMSKGWVWELDNSERRHRADGLALSPNKRVAIEVELTAKEPRRLKSILLSLIRRIDIEEIHEVWYYCTPAAAAALHRAVESMTKEQGIIFGHSLKILEHFDALGNPKERAKNHEESEG